MSLNGSYVSHLEDVVSTNIFFSYFENPMGIEGRFLIIFQPDIKFTYLRVVKLNEFSQFILKWIPYK